MQRFNEAYVTLASLRSVQTTILYEKKAACGLSLHFVALWLKWHVTRSVRAIYETTKTQAEIDRRLQMLVAYMKWHNPETLDAYEHYFDAARHADLLEELHLRMHTTVEEQLKEARGERAPRHQEPPADPAHNEMAPMPDEPDFAFLYQLGGNVS